jgi:site-specific DNA-methyltransferase (adenine-specific)
MFELHHGDCLGILRTIPEASVDSIVTDPPYGLAFMGKRWDYDVPSVEIWAECLRVLRPGGHILAFAGTRTQHRMAVRIEDAGFEIRDMIAWVYGSGFPKSLDVSKAIDQAAGAEREVVGETRKGAQSESTGRYGAWGDGITPTAPATPEAQQWSGWGTALKPALEPITVARKPLEGTVAANVLAHGTGALNVDGCRIAASDGYTENAVTQGVNTARTSYAPAVDRRTFEPSTSGRWPANLIHDGSDEVVAGFPETDPARVGRRGRAHGRYTNFDAPDGIRGHDDDGGSAARFFYCAKASAEDRGPGNHHPTVKPTDLMRYLCRLVTPPDGVVLDPFTGSGSTGRGAVLEGFAFIGCELDPEYLEIARTRILAAERAYQPCLKLS